MPTFIATTFGFVQANWSHVMQLVLMLTLLGAFLNWIASLLVARSWTKTAQAIAAISSIVGDAVKVIGYAVSLLFSIFGQTPPPMARRMMRGPFDDTITPLGSKKLDPPMSPYRINIREMAEPSSSLRFRVGAGLMMLALVIIPISLTMLVGCPQAVQTGLDGAKTYACVSAEIDRGDDTFEGIAQACGVDVVSNVVDVVNDILAAEKKPTDAGLVSTTLPTDFARKAMAVHHAADGGSQ